MTRFDQALDQARDIAGRDHESLRYFAQHQPLIGAIELRQDVETRQAELEFAIEMAANVVLDEARAGEEPEPQPQLHLVIGRPRGYRRLRIDPQGLVGHGLPPAIVIAWPVTAEAPSEQSHKAASATSRGVINRPDGLVLAKWSIASPLPRPVLLAKIG